MQTDAIAKWHESKKHVVLYSPTGTGKTLAFALPILRDIDQTINVTQCVIVEPTRELVLQITEVLKKLAPLVKTTPCYGGHNSHDEQSSLAQKPAIVVATPGRLLDHIERGNVSLMAVATLVLDEFDKSLELGFAEEMRGIIVCLPATVRTMMTSATLIRDVPDFIDFSKYETINFLHHDELSPQGRITSWQVRCEAHNRLTCLINLLVSLPDERIIVFANQRDTATVVYRQLVEAGIAAGLYIGTLEQSQREKVLAMFRNGSLLVLVTTDLGGRGIDIDDIKHIIHYEQPNTSEVFTHRNGRTARVDASGEVYVITCPGETVAPFITIDRQYCFDSLAIPKMKSPARATILISAGKREKISRGDIVGYLLHNCPILDASDITGINIFDHHTLVGVPSDKAEEVVKTISPFKLKKQKVKSAVIKFRPRFVR